MLSFDEWNVWYWTRRSRTDRVKKNWPVAPDILEEVYTMEDAPTFGGACLSLLNHADRVKAACLAQLVNAIAPILTETGGPAWRQTIFYPFAHMSNFGRGHVLQTKVESPTYAATYYDPRGNDELRFPIPSVPYLKFSAVHDRKGGSLTLFALNRSLDSEMTLRAAAKDLGKVPVTECLTLHDRDLGAKNTKSEPDRIRPVPLDAVTAKANHVMAALPPASWNVIRLDMRQ